MLEIQSSADVWMAAFPATDFFNKLIDLTGCYNITSGGRPEASRLSVQMIRPEGSNLTLGRGASKQQVFEVFVQLEETVVDHGLFQQRPRQGVWQVSSLRQSAVQRDVKPVADLFVLC